MRDAADAQFNETIRMNSCCLNRSDRTQSNTVDGSCKNACIEGDNFDGEDAHRYYVDGRIVVGNGWDEV